MLLTTTTQTITLIDIVQWCGQHIIELLLCLGIFIEITPIKISPISFIMKLLFKPIRTEMSDMKSELNNNINNLKTELKGDISEIKKEQQSQSNTIAELIKTSEKNEIDRIRWTIIEFARSIDNKQLHRRDEYLCIKDLNVRYHTLIKKYNLTNGMIDDEMEKINEHYTKNKGNESAYF